MSILILALTVAAFEWELGRLGYVANASESDARWLHERARASQLGPRALILVGASRIQLGLDLEVLRKETGLEPVQLALDGSGGIPLLAGLARDPSIKGTSLVDYYDNALAAEGGAAVALERR